mmetsp:Transcript_52469/g.152712  ORF Transcript_52469/g.152712 Transcript_52469/m.152712 type:complete len:500 (+) Transcript_52469:59-1558(+)
MSRVAALAALGALTATSCSATWTGGSIVLKPNSMTFLSKFCFSYDPKGRQHLAGVLDLQVYATSDTRSHQAYMAILDDEPDSYTGPSSGWSEMTCEERLQRTKQSMYIDWTLASRPEGQDITLNIHQKVRPRWWYVVLLDCSIDDEDPSDVEISYDAHLTNSVYGPLREFSTDRRFTLPLYMVLAAVYGAMACAQLGANSALLAHADLDSASSKAAHPFARLLLVGICAGLVEMVLLSLHAGIFMFDGVGAPILAFGGQLLATTSTFILVSLLLLVSEGKCVSYIMVANDARRMINLLGPFFLSCCCLELWGEYSVWRHSTTDYVYTHPLGWALIFVDLLLLRLYARNARETFLAERESDVGAFYRTWGVVFGLWFAALPVTAVLAQAVLAPYTWYIVSLGVKQGSTAAVYAALITGLWPGNRRTYFRRMEAPGSCTEERPASALRRETTVLPLPKRLPGLLGSGAKMAQERLAFKGECKAERRGVHAPVVSPRLAMSP